MPGYTYDIKWKEMGNYTPTSQRQSVGPPGQKGFIPQSVLNIDLGFAEQVSPESALTHKLSCWSSFASTIEQPPPHPMDQWTRTEPQRPYAVMLNHNNLGMACTAVDGLLISKLQSNATRLPHIWTYIIDSNIAQVESKKGERGALSS